MGKRKKPTNKELTEGIMNLHRKVDVLCNTTQKVLADFITFLGKEQEFKDYLKKKYEITEQEKDTKKSS